MRQLLLITLCLACAHSPPPARLDPSVDHASGIGGIVTDAKTGAPLVNAYVKIRARPP